MLTQIELLKKYNLSVKGHLGQHLLIDPNSQRKIVDALDSSAGNDVIEIGPGLGALTGEMLKRGRRVWAVEKDARFVEILKQEFAAYKDHLKILHADALDADLKKLVKGCTSKGPLKLISNLPYYITAPLLFHILSYRGLISKAVVMMQKEVAARLLASPGSKDYSRLTLGVRYSGSVEHIFDIPPTCFAPPPEVHSTVLEITFFPEEKRLPERDETFLFKVIEVAFSQRRKTLLGLLTRSPEIGVTREQLGPVFESMGLKSTVRGEELLLKDFLTLAAKINLDCRGRCVPSQ
jgi:16S rRNA (adenine1518-N6/adenine1519-N6)-dimethyltransferase